jgi:hypothetical protein
MCVYCILDVRAHIEPWPFLGNFFSRLPNVLGQQGSVRRKASALHRTVQQRKTRTPIHACSGIRTHDSNIRTANIHTLDSASIVTVGF